MWPRAILHVVDHRAAVRAGIASAAYAADLHCEIHESHAECKAALSRNAAAADTRVAIVLAGECVALGPLIADVAATGRSLPVIAMAEQPSISQVVTAMQTGASDFLELPANSAQLALLFERYGRLAQANELRGDAGGSVFPTVTARSQLNRLTLREQDVLRALADGLSNKEIARELAISPRTVEQHRRAMMGKLRASHVADALRIYWAAKQPSVYSAAPVVGGGAEVGASAASLSAS